MFGNVTCSKLPLNLWPNFRVWRELGKVTRSKLWLNCRPRVKLWRLLGQDIPSKLWSKAKPKVRVWRLFGSVMRRKSWLKQFPNVKLRRLDGKATRSKLWLKFCPKVKSWRLLGRVTPSKVWLNMNPRVKLCSLLGQVTHSRLWLKLSQRVKLWSVCGRLPKYFPGGTWSKQVTPFNASSSASEVSISWIRHHARYKFVAMRAPDKVAAPKMPCSCKVWCILSLDSMQYKTNFVPGLPGSWSETICWTSRPRVEWWTFNVTPSPVKHSTRRSTWLIEPLEDGLASPSLSCLFISLVLSLKSASLTFHWCVVLDLVS